MTDHPPFPWKVKESIETLSKKAWLKEVQRQIKRVDKLQEKYEKLFVVPENTTPSYTKKWKLVIELR